jgi:hypothetical protein
MSAHVGHLPDTFDKFLRELGIPTSSFTFEKQKIRHNFDDFDNFDNFDTH